MKKLVSTLNLPREEWLRYRKQGIGGSDAGAICGFNPYHTTMQVYYDKTSDEIEDILTKSGQDIGDDMEGTLILKQGDGISLTVKNSSKTLSQSLKNFYYNIAGSDIQIIAATASGTVAINGTR